MAAITYVPEKPEHAAEIEAVLSRAFGPGRFVKSSERVRERGAMHEPSLSRVALEQGVVRGVCRIWRVRAGVTFHFLGPLAVDPAAQHAGVGAALVEACVEAVRAIGGAGVVLVGAEPFFRPLGFSLVPEGRLTLPGPFDPQRLLWRELARNGLASAQGQISAP
ncbi:MAG: GNAT family N-acetyltransferase [Hyphomonadaceae bacterium]